MQELPKGCHPGRGCFTCPYEDCVLSDRVAWLKGEREMQEGEAHPRTQYESARAAMLQRQARYQARYRARHRERVRAWARAYYAAHRDAIRARARAYYAAHREAIRAKQRAYYARKRRENREMEVYWVPDGIVSRETIHEGMKTPTEGRRVMIKVKLLSCTPAPERVIACAARLCTSGEGAAALSGKITEARAAQLVRKMLACGHLSTLEHVSFTFAAEGVSRVLTHQLVRHRIASYEQQSQRYVRAGGACVVPPAIAANEQLRAQYESLVQTARDFYEALTTAGIAKEDARYILPHGMETKILITMNGRSLLHFFRLRCCQRAQWEIRALAAGMLKEARRVAPVLFEKAGATCEAEGRCPEGEKTCGRLAK